MKSALLKLQMDMILRGMNLDASESRSLRKRIEN